MIELIESLLQKTGEELHNAAQEFAKNGDYDNYCVYLIMSANFDYPDTKDTIFIHDYLFDKQDYSRTRQFYKLTSFGSTKTELSDPITNFVNSSRNSYSLRYLGYMYRGGHGVKKNFRKAIKCYKLAIKKGNYETLTRLGQMYYYTTKIQNYEKAQKLFELAIEKKVPSAFADLGKMYEDGFGVEQDYQRAIELYQEGVKYDDCDALCDLGRMYLYGKGVEVNVSIAKSLLKSAIQKGNNSVLCILGNMYYYGTEHNKQNNKKAKKFYKIAVAFDPIVHIFFKLAKIYHLEEKYAKSIECYNKAADNGHVGAMIKMGHIYRWGDNIPKDLQKAKEFYKQAQKCGDSCDSVHGIGGIYYDEKNYQKAKKYWELAIIENNSYAMADLGYIYQAGLGVDVDFQKAVEFYEMGYKNENGYATNNLASMYHNGLGIPVDIKKAIELFKIAYELGNKIALDNLVTAYKSNKDYDTQSDVTNYFIKINKAEKLKEIYEYDYLHIELLKKVYLLEQELDKVKKMNTDMENHIKASPDGELYFSAVKDWDERNANNC